MLRKCLGVLRILCMEERSGHFQFHTFSRVFSLSLEYNHAMYANITKVVKIQGKILEVVLAMAICIGLAHGRLSTHYTHCHDGAFRKG